MHVHACTYIYLPLHICTHIHTYIHIYAYIHIYIYTYIHVHPHTYVNNIYFIFNPDLNQNFLFNIIRFNYLN